MKRLPARPNQGNGGENHELVARIDDGREQKDGKKPIPWESTKTARWASNARRERKDVIFRKPTYNAETGTRRGGTKQRGSA